MIKLFFVLITLFGLAQSCSDHNKKGEKPHNTRNLDSSLIEANKMYVKRESDEIDQYAARRKWKMTTTGTGLRYMITKPGPGTETAKNEQVVKVDYKISLLDGTLCYSSEKDGPKEFMVGKDNIESGLHEGIQFMKQGDEAVFILPSHLAHGLMGDGNKIPAKASVVYEIKLISIR
ncbi:MAG TPA: FKBP-type peptidyl-prolyl cis-trans isomerase [Bacteroidia bacterium]|jgi:FKBP-type peptidyl-prolyl cis-trans isomerase